MRVLLDTNILVRLRDADSPLHSLCVEAIERLINQMAQICLCLQVLIEFWSVSTRPREANGMGLSPEEAYAECQRFRSAFSLLEEPPEIADRWLSLAHLHNIRGKQVHDARIVAFAQAHQIDAILTLNPDDFARYDELTILTPDEVLR
jgi:Predicted nucleic acid-binding protein, contains PIN domain